MDALSCNKKVIKVVILLQCALKIDMDHYYATMMNLYGKSMVITLLTYD